MQTPKQAPPKQTGEAKQRTSSTQPQESSSQVDDIAVPDARPETLTQRKLQASANQYAQSSKPYQLQALSNNASDNNPNGLPAGLRSGIESLSGHSMADVTVHKNSSKPAQLNAHAYAQGNQIHLGPGQEKHLPHEAWHVVQQKQGRVKPTTQLHGMGVNTDKALEDEADNMGAKALSVQRIERHPNLLSAPESRATLQAKADTIQLAMSTDLMMSSLWNFFKSQSLHCALKAGDVYVLNKMNSVENLQAFYEAMTNLQYVLTQLMNIWNLVPAPVRTILLYLAGKALGATAGNRREAIVVGLDEDPSKSTIAWVVKMLGLAISAYTSPVSTAASLLGSAWGLVTGSSSDKKTDTPKKPETTDKDVANINLKIIGMDIKKLNLQKDKKPPTEEGPQKDKKTNDHGGMHASFALWVDAFGIKKSVGKSGDLKMVLPWNGPAIVHLTEDMTIFESTPIPESILVLNDFQLRELKVEGKDIQTLSMKLERLAIAGDFFEVNSLKGTYENSKLGFTSNKINIRLFNWQAGASNASVQLDADNKFESASISNFNESNKILTVEKAEFDKESASITEAKVTLPESTGLNLSASASATFKKGGKPTGKGEINTKDVELFGKNVMLETAKGNLAVTDAGWNVRGKAGLKMAFPYIKSANGTFVVEYDHLKSGKDTFSLDMSGGKFKADFGAFGLDAENMTYSSKEGKFTIATATMNLKAINTEARVEGVEVTSSGVNFKEATVNYKGNLTPFQGFTLEKPRFTVSNDNGYALSATTGLTLDSAKMHIGCKAEELTLAFSDKKFSGSLKALDVTSPAFGLNMQGVTVDEDGLQMTEATITLGSTRNSSNDEKIEAVTNANKGLFDFLPMVTQLSFKVTGVSVTKKGLKITGFEPQIPPVSFNAFGISGGMNFQTYEAYLNGKKSFELTDYLPESLTKVGVDVPVLPGIEIAGYIKATAGLGFKANLTAEREETAWKVKGGGGLHGKAGIEAGLGVNLGSRAILAVYAGFSANGKAAVDADASITGQAVFDKTSKRFKNGGTPPTLDYSSTATVTAEVNFDLKGKALVFFEKTIYQYKIAEWTIGQYQMEGQIGNKGDDLAMEPPTKLGMKEKSLSIPRQEHKGSEVQPLLESDEYIYASNDARLEVLQEKQATITTELNKLGKQYQTAAEQISSMESKYIALITHKDTLYRLQMPELSDTEANARLESFNKKWNIEALLDKYATSKDEIAALDFNIKAQKSNLEQVMNRIESKNLDEGVQSELSDLSGKESETREIVIPKLDKFVANFGTASDELAPIVVSMTSAQQAKDRIMSSQAFLEISTTKTGPFKNPRKRVETVDNALAKFHQNKSTTNLEALSTAIEQYLKVDDSSRKLAVATLKRQVDDALET